MLPGSIPNLQFLVTCTSSSHKSQSHGLTQIQTNGFLGKPLAPTAQELAPTLETELDKSTRNRSRGINTAWSR